MLYSVWCCTRPCYNSTWVCSTLLCIFCLIMLFYNDNKIIIWQVYIQLWFLYRVLELIYDVKCIYSISWLIMYISNVVDASFTVEYTVLCFCLLIWLIGWYMINTYISEVNQHRDRQYKTLPPINHTHGSYCECFAVVWGQSILHISFTSLALGTLCANKANEKYC